MNRLAMRIGDWPQVDRALLDGLFRNGDPLKERGRFAHYRPATQEKLRYHYGRWLAWLAESDPAGLQEASCSRATAERVTLWIDSVSHLVSGSRLTMLEQTVRLLQADAPNQDWRAHQRLAKGLRRAARDHRMQDASGPCGIWP